jgi:hypothetical protein
MKRFVQPTLSFGRGPISNKANTATGTLSSYIFMIEIKSNLADQTELKCPMAPPLAAHAAHVTLLANVC